jgi:hypothetical protein
MPPLSLGVTLTPLHLTPPLFTSNQILPVLNKLTALVVTVANKLLESKEIEDTSAYVEL